MEWQEGLKSEIKGNVLVDETTLTSFSHDASIFEIKPEAVVEAKNVSDIQNIVSFVKKNKIKYPNLSITARSAGTDMSGGVLNNSIIIDFTKHINQLVELNPDLKYAIIEPGLYYRDFEKVTLQNHLIFPAYPASKSIAAMGGIIANNAAGEKSLKYGKTDKFIMELEVVLSDGNSYSFKPITKLELNKKISQKNFEGKIYRQILAMIEKNFDKIQAAKPKVAKNSAGYSLWDVWDGTTFDLTKLFVGSQGTLGIITKAKIGLVDVEKEHRMGVIFLRSFEDLPKVTKAVLSLNPSSIETFDDETLKLALRFLPEIARHSNQSLWRLAKEFLPEIILGAGLMRLPKLIVLVEFAEDNKEIIEGKVNKFNQIIKSNKWLGMVLNEGKEEKYWVVRRESFNLLRQHAKNLHAAPFIDDVCVPIDVMPQFLEDMMKILNKEDIHVTLAGHAGEGNFHVIPLVDFTNLEEIKKIPRVCDAVYSLVLHYGGSTTGEHNDGIIRSRYLPKMFGLEIFKLFVETKQIFDPQNIFNPGKKVNFSPNFATSLLRRNW